MSPFLNENAGVWM